MWKDRFRNILGDSPQSGSTPQHGAKPGAKHPAGRNGSSQPFTRQSSGTDQFFQALRREEALSILDMGGASQANISYITELGHRLSSEDIVGTMDLCFGGDGDFLENQEVPAKIERFLDQILNFPDQHFDAALAWDSLQFLAPPLLEEVINRMLRVMRPGGFVLAFFSANDKITNMPMFSYRIQDSKTLLLVPRNQSRQIHYFNNRTLERFFESAQAVKFFLSRDHLREVLIRR